MPEALDGTLLLTCREPSVDEMQAVLEVLRQSPHHLTADQIARLLGLEVPVVERALQGLLFRRRVICRSHEPTGSSRICLPIWSADPHDD